MQHPLYVAFLWHMHQPYYRNTVTGTYLLPWVRLHAVKDYLHMVEILRDFPPVKQTFNLVPCLVEQIQDYVEGRAVDEYLRLTLKPAEVLSDAEKRFLMDNFFSISWDRVVRRYPRYWQLLQLREQAPGDVRLFGPAYWRDLQTWFNLAWIDPNWLEGDRDLARLVDKGRNFTPDEVRLVVAKQREMLSRVVPTYRALAEQGQIELTTTPYYHPILPLLVNARSAREAIPRLPLPENRFAHPEDAAEQIRLAVESHASCFGMPPSGMWPAEGAVSQEAVGLLRRQPSLRWLASDEGILAGSLGQAVQRDGYGHVTNPRLLYQPYWVGEPGVSGESLAMVFRDRLLSDRIGFVYQQWGGQAAAEDLVNRLHQVRQNLADPEVPYLVSIILDGENCWEGYEHNGDVFLRRLYELLSQTPGLETTTIGTYLNRFPPRARVPRLRAGSWINANLETWIGEPAQNRAWEYLVRTRERLIAWQNQSALDDLETLAAAWREVYMAEGSDWFWWYYSRNMSAQDSLFDAEFRGHLANVYRIMGLPVPTWLEQPIAKVLLPTRSYALSGRVSPSLRAAEQAGPDWAAAGFLEQESPGSGGAMQRTAGLLTGVYYGHDAQSLYLRLEASEDLEPCFVGVYFSSSHDGRVNYRLRYAETNPEIAPPDITFGLEVAKEPAARRLLLSQAEGLERWEAGRPIGEMAVGPRVLEMRLPLAELGLSQGQSVGLVIMVAKNGVLAETLPRSGHLAFTLLEGEG